MSCSIRSSKLLVCLQLCRSALMVWNVERRLRKEAMADGAIQMPELFISWKRSARRAALLHSMIEFFLRQMRGFLQDLSSLDAFRREVTSARMDGSRGCRTVEGPSIDG
mgnify:FL=1